MPDREKLIDLLLCVPFAEVIFGKREGKRYTTAWRIADHLIANGVTVRERGHWEDIYKGKYANPRFRCSVCKANALYVAVQTALGTWRDDQDLSNFCPNCGADMRGEEDA